MPERISKFEREVTADVDAWLDGRPRGRLPFHLCVRASPRVPIDGLFFSPGGHGAHKALALAWESARRLADVKAKPCVLVVPSTYTHPVALCATDTLSVVIAQPGAMMRVRYDDVDLTVYRWADFLDIHLSGDPDD